MEHDHDVRPGLQSFDITGFLIAAVALVFAMKKNAEAQLARHLDRRVAGDIIDDDAFLDAAGWNVEKGLLDGLAGVVGRHDGDYFRCIHSRAGTVWLPE